MAGALEPPPAPAGALAPAEAGAALEPSPAPAGALAPAGATAGVPPGTQATRPAYVVVAEGDTLWDLVAPHAPPGTDPAVYAARTAAAAGLDPRALVPGTVIRLP